MRSTAAGFRSGWVALLLTSVSRAVTSLVLSLLLVTVIPAFFGWHPTVVMSGSMEPRIQPGDVVVACPATADQVRLGQILLVHDPDWPGRTRLHRLVRVDARGRLVLEGDANGHPDSSPVTPSAVMGIACLRAPMLGAPELWAATGQVGPLAGLAGAAVLVLGGCFLFRSPGGPRPPGSPPPAGEPREQRPRFRRPTRRAAGATATIAAPTLPRWPSIAAERSGPRIV